METLRQEEREVLLLASGFLSLKFFMSFTAASFNHLSEAAAVCTFYVYIYIYIYIASLSHLETPTLCDPIDGSPPGSLVPGILQARTLEWIAISFSNA